MAKYKFKNPEYKECISCNGTGMIFIIPYGKQTCRLCNGSGVIESHDNTWLSSKIPKV